MTTTQTPQTPRDVTTTGAHVLDVTYLCDRDGIEHDSYHQRDADGAFLCAQCGAELTEASTDSRRSRGTS